MSTTATIRLYDNELVTKGDLKLAIAESKVDTIKWMVGLWLAQMAAIIGLYLTK